MTEYEHGYDNGYGHGLISRFVEVLDGAREAANRSVLDGTVSCKICRALVLEENEDGHYAWHGGRP